MIFVHGARTGGKTLKAGWGLSWPEARPHGPPPTDLGRVVNGVASYTVARPPWEREVSLYERARLLHGTPIPRDRGTRPPEWERLFGRPFPDFDEWLTGTVTVNRQVMPITEWCYQGLYASHMAVPIREWAAGVDRVVQFDNWDVELAQLASDLGRPFVPITKSNRRMRDYYDATTETLVGTRYAADLTAYGYEYRA